jgi:integrase
MTDGDTTFDVRVYRTEIYRGTRVTTYKVRWKTDGRLWKQPFRTAAQADSFRSSLLTAARRGAAFSLSTGRPASWKQSEPTITWYELTLRYTSIKWPHAAPTQRRSIAETLTDATEAMITTAEMPWPRADIRSALRNWAFSERMQSTAQPPADIEPIISWLRTATAPVSALGRPETGPALTRALLNRLGTKQDSTAAAANTVNRKRGVLSGLMRYAVEVGAIAVNPLESVTLSRPRGVRAVDPRTVINADQAHRLLQAVGQQDERGPRMVAFFGCIYYAAMRPEEVIALNLSNLASLPDAGWGEATLTGAEPRSGAHWTDSGNARQPRELKHRAPGDTRSVPLHPQLVRLLTDHMASFPPARDGRIFTGPRGGIFTDRSYLLIFHKARSAAFTAAEIASLAAHRPYDLRHAAVSTWLNAGVPAPQVAAWAGHSVAVLLRVYAKCISGQQDEAKRRIEAATQLTDGQ